MEYNILGRTGLKVSVAGLGCGGHSRLGLATGGSEEQAVALVRQALNLGINLIDTAEAYGTEEVVGRAVAGRREGVVLCTKKGVRLGEELLTAAAMRDGVHASLRRLGMDCVDIFYLHGLALRDYDYAVSEMLPVLQQLRDEGKLRHIGVTEAFNPDPGHQTLRRAVQDDCWDVMMVGFNILNQSARERVFPGARQHHVGLVNMFAVRRALSRPDALREVLRDLAERGVLSVGEDDLVDPVGFLLPNGQADELTDAAYRFCRHEPGMDVVLFGTGNPAHLEANVASLLRPPLPGELVRRWRELFAGVDWLSGN